MTFSSGEVLTAANLNALDINSLALSAGITFSGGANDLDDYEEGTWSPSYDSYNADMTGVVVNSTFTKGSYTKVGNLVMASFFIRTDSIGSVGTGAARLVGLPFDTRNVASYHDLVSSVSVYFAFGTLGPDVISLRNNTNYASLKSHNTGGAVDSNVQASDLSTAANRNGICGYVVYQTD